MRFACEPNAGSGDGYALRASLVMVLTEPGGEGSKHAHRFTPLTCS
ncbi:MAG: hypothetical protein RL685_4154 [Pseudomonadota bacterium]|jgi:hypothetical protein